MAGSSLLRSLLLAHLQVSTAGGAAPTWRDLLCLEWRASLGRHHRTEDVPALYPETCERQGVRREHLGQRSRCSVANLEEDTGWEVSSMLGCAGGCSRCLSRAAAADVKSSDGSAGAPVCQRPALLPTSTLHCSAHHPHTEALTFELPQEQPRGGRADPVTYPPTHCLVIIEEEIPQMCQSSNFK